MPEAKTSKPDAKVKPGAILRAMKTGEVAQLPSLNDDSCGGEPELTVHREDGRIRRIVARCVCGRKIDIHCDYEEPDT